MPSDRKRINLMVDAEQKERWQKAADGPEYRDLSDLIRTSVRRELVGESSQQNTASPSSGPVEVELPDDLRATLDRIDRGLAEVNDRLDAIEGERETETDLYQLSQTVFDILPTPPNVERESDLRPYDEWAATPDSLADQLNEDVENIDEALSRLQEMTAQIKGVAGDDGRYFWRTE